MAPPRGLTRFSKRNSRRPYCIDVLTQISAIQAALDKISLGLLDDHARHCMQGKSGAPSDPEEQVDKWMGAVGRLLHH